jgi:hypothetical protein
MAVLSGEFTTALERIEPSEDDKQHAPVAHSSVRGSLKASTVLSRYGIDPVLIGSYKRYVSVRRVKDVDVFCRLPDLPLDVGAQDLLDDFFSVLDDAYGTTSDGQQRVKRQARSVQVLFPEYDGLYVDAVPARRHWDGVSWEIPKREDDDWQQTNPEMMTTESSAMNDRHGDLYVPTVKLLRQTRRRLLGRAKPGGLLVELAAFEACRRGIVLGNNQADFYASAMEGVATVIAEHVGGDEIPDPTLPGHTVKVRATEIQWVAARDKFQSAAEKARDAYKDTDRCSSAKKFRDLLGGNDDFDLVLPMPSDCNEDGTSKASAIVAGDRHVPAGNRRFG